MRDTGGDASEKLVINPDNRAFAKIDSHEGKYKFRKTQDILARVLIIKNR